MYRSAHLHIWPSTCLYIYLCLYLSPVGKEARGVSCRASLVGCPRIRIVQYIYIYICVCVWVGVYLSIYPPTYVSVHLHMYISIYLYIYVCIYLSPVGEAVHGASSIHLFMYRSAK